MSSFVEFAGDVALFEYPCGNESECVHISKKLIPGIYLFEVYGAQGGCYNDIIPMGGYSRGILSIVHGVDIFINIGSMGKCIQGDVGSPPPSFNGGGQGRILYSTHIACSGGGATDIRIGINDIFHRVIVAGGGGGSSFYNSQRTGGAGGGLIGLNASGPNGCTIGTGGTQTEGGKTNPLYPSASGSFGIGGTVIMWDGGGGGGGWFGGAAGQGCVEAGGGGSGFVFSSLTLDTAINAGLLLSSKSLLRNGYTKGGDQEFPGFDTDWVRGRLGNGAAKITLIGYHLMQTCLSPIDSYFSPDVVLLSISIFALFSGI